MLFRQLHPVLKRSSALLGAGRRLYSTVPGVRALTVVNPTRTSLDHLLRAEGSSSVIILATPQHAPTLLELVKSNPLSAEQPLQIFAAAVDTIPFGSQRNGYSLLYLPNRLNIRDAVPYGGQDEGGEPTEVNGLASGRQNWNLTTSLLSFVVGGSSELVLPIANTVFTTGRQSVMALNSPSTDGSFQTLSSARVELPPLGPSHLHHNVYSPLRPVGPQEMEVTDCKDNMIKTLEKRPAASFLEDAPELTEGDAATQRSRKVYAVVSSETATTRYQVLAGGGGSWSPRQSMLVLEPTAKLNKGDLISFYYSDPSIVEANDEHLRKDINSVMKDNKSVQLVFEASPVLESLRDEPYVSYDEDVVLENVFGAGTESGFLLNDTKHSVESEMAVLSHLYSST